MSNLVLPPTYTQSLSAQLSTSGCLLVSHTSLHHHHHHCRRQVNFRLQDFSPEPDPLETYSQTKTIFSRAHRGGFEPRSRVQRAALIICPEGRCLIRPKKGHLLVLFNLKPRGQVNERCLLKKTDTLKTCHGCMRPALRESVQVLDNDSSLVGTVQCCADLAGTNVSQRSLLVSLDYPEAVSSFPCGHSWWKT